MELKYRREAIGRPIAPTYLVIIKIAWRDIAVDAQVARSCRRFDAKARFYVTALEFTREKGLQLQESQPLSLSLRQPDVRDLQ